MAGRIVRKMCSGYLALLLNVEVALECWNGNLECARFYTVLEGGCSCRSILRYHPDLRVISLGIVFFH